MRISNFSTPTEMVERILAFVSHWNRREAHPFRWTFRGRFEQHPEQRAA